MKNSFHIIIIVLIFVNLILTAILVKNQISIGLSESSAALTPSNKGPIVRYYDPETGNSISGKPSSCSKIDPNGDGRCNDVSQSSDGNTQVALNDYLAQQKNIICNARAVDQENCSNSKDYYSCVKRQTDKRRGTLNSASGTVALISVCCGEETARGLVDYFSGACPAQQK